MCGMTVMAKFGTKRALITVLLLLARNAHCKSSQFIPWFLGGLVINLLSSFNHYLWPSADPFFFHLLLWIFYVRMTKYRYKVLDHMTYATHKIFSQKNEAFRRWVENFTSLHFLSCKMQACGWLYKHSCNLCFFVLTFHSQPQISLNAFVLFRMVLI